MSATLRANAAKYHGAYPGGLCDHSLNVYHCLVDYLSRKALLIALATSLVTLLSLTLGTAGGELLPTGLSDQLGGLALTGIHPSPGGLSYPRICHSPSRVSRIPDTGRARALCRAWPPWSGRPPGLNFPR